MSYRFKRLKNKIRTTAFGFAVACLMYVTMIKKYGLNKDVN